MIPKFSVMSTSSPTPRAGSYQSNQYIRFFQYELGHCNYIVNPRAASPVGVERKELEIITSKVNTGRFTIASINISGQNSSGASHDFGSQPIDQV